MVSPRIAAICHSTITAGAGDEGESQGGRCKTRYSTGDFQEITQTKTNPAQPNLRCEFRWDRLFSWWYDRITTTVLKILDIVATNIDAAVQGAWLWYVAEPLQRIVHEPLPTHLWVR